MSLAWFIVIPILVSSNPYSIVFVHGLKGDCLKTWKDKNATEPWPKTLLPLELGTARVLTYSYDSTVTGKEGSPSQNRISNHAQNLLAALATLRQNDNTVRAQSYSSLISAC